MIVLAKDNKEKLINFIAKHQIENTRKSHINELKDGFNIFNLINVCIYLLLIKMNYLKGKFISHPGVRSIFLTLSRDHIMIYKYNTYRLVTLKFAQLVQLVER